LRKSSWRPTDFGNQELSGQRSAQPENPEERQMKSKALLIASTLLMALALMAQTTTQNPPANGDNIVKACACCNHDQADGKKMECCGKDAKCCAGGADCCKGKDGKACPMMSKDTTGKMNCCAEGKCGMMSKKDSKGCCGGKMCARPQAGA